MKSFFVRFHACWLDKECRKLGVPAFTYIPLTSKTTFRINPPYQGIMRLFDESPWSWRIFQIIKRP